MQFTQMNSVILPSPHFVFHKMDYFSINLYTVFPGTWLEQLVHFQRYCDTTLIIKS